MAKKGNIKVVKNNKNDDLADITDIELLIVSDSKEEIVEYDRQRIVDSLMKETNMARSTAQVVANSVDRKINESGNTVLSTSFIRGLVQMELRDKGFTKKLEEYDNVAVPIYNIEQMISPSYNNGTSLDRTATSVSNHVASYVLKNFSLKRIFSPDVRAAHLSGQIHLHGLAYPNCFYQGMVSVEHMKKMGVGLHKASLKTQPPADIYSLVDQMLDFVFDYQSHFSGVVGLSHFNVFLSPYISDIKNDEIAGVFKQFLMRVCKSAALKNGQNKTLEIGLDLDVPDFLSESPAIGANGKYMALVTFDDDTTIKIPLFDKPMRGSKWQSRYKKTLKKEFDKKIKDIRLATYADFEKEASKIFTSILIHCSTLDVDRIILSPIKLAVAVSDAKTFNTSLWNVVLEAITNGANINILFNRPEDQSLFREPCGISINLSANGKKKSISADPRKINEKVLHHITVNLPRCVYDLGDKNVTKHAVFRNLTNICKVVVDAHVQKIKCFSDIAESGFFSSIYDIQDVTLFDFETPTCSIGMVGLGEMIDLLINALGNDTNRYDLSLEVLAHMYMEAQRLGEENGLNIVLDSSVFEFINMRFSRMDFRRYEQSKDVINGDKRTTKVYYTDSVYTKLSNELPPPEQIIKEAPKHRIIRGRVDVPVFIGNVTPEAINKFLQFIWQESDCCSISLPINLYIYEEEEGLSLKMEYLDNPPNDILAYNGYTYSLVSAWNDAKLGEFYDRVLWEIALDNDDLVFTKETQKTWSDD